MLGAMLRAAGLRSGVVYVSDGVMKAGEVIRMVAECRAQESIRSMTERILTENKKATGQSDFNAYDLRKCASFIMPDVSQIDKGVQADA